MATVTEIADTDAGITYVGTWTTNNGITGSTGPSTHYTNVATDTVSYTFTGRSLYLLGWDDTAAGTYSVTVDGVLITGTISHYTPTTGDLSHYLRVVQPLVRGLSDASHTVKLTCLSGQLGVDGFLVVTGAKGAPTPGNYVALGDSWTYGTGATSPALGGFPALTSNLLAARLGRGLTAIAKGVSGDSLFCSDGASANGGNHYGGMYRAFSDVLPQTPEFLSIEFAANDLRPATLAAYTGHSCTPAEFGRNLARLLTFLDDTLVLGADPNNQGVCKVAVCSPGHLTPSLLVAPVGTAVMPGLDLWERAVDMSYAAAALFPSVRVAGLYAVMESRDQLLYPNANGDPGLHPNDEGHGVIGLEVARTLMGG